jgi:hypothetical protein
LACRLHTHANNDLRRGGEEEAVAIDIRMNRKEQIQNVKKRAGGWRRRKEKKYT